MSAFYFNTFAKHKNFPKVLSSFVIVTVFYSSQPPFVAATYTHTHTPIAPNGTKRKF